MLNMIQDVKCLLHLNLFVESRVFILEAFFVCFFVCLFTPPLPRDGGTAQTAIRIHAVNLIEIRLEERWQPILNQS